MGASRKCPNFLDLGIYERPYMHKQNDVSRRKEIHNARTSFHAYVLGCESGQKEISRSAISKYYNTILL